MADSTSINLQQGQEDEAIADMVSAEVIAQLMSEVSLSQKLNFLANAIEPFCLFSTGSNNNFLMDLVEAHSMPLLRVSGIYGGGKSIRSALGCEEPSSSQDFKTCSWPETK